MQFFSALLGHFIVGVLSFIWIIPFLLGLDVVEKDQFITLIKDYKEIVLVLIAPTSYVLGIYIDIVASIFTRYLKTIIYKIYSRKVTDENDQVKETEEKYKSYERTAKILKSSNIELARYLLMLSGREKIARGIFLNSLFAGIIFSIFAPHKSYNYAIFCFAFAISSFLMWMRLNVKNNRFKTQALS